MKQVKRDREEIEREEAVGPAEEVARERAFRALERRGLGGDLPAFKVEVGDGCDIEKRMLANDRIIALEHVLVVRIEPASGAIRVVIGDRMALAIPVPGGVADAPAIFDRNEMVRFLELRRHDARRTGEADGWVIGKLEQRDPIERAMEAGSRAGAASIGRASKLGRGESLVVLRARRAQHEPKISTAASATQTKL